MVASTNNLTFTMEFSTEELSPFSATLPDGEKRDLEDDDSSPEYEDEDTSSEYGESEDEDTSSEYEEEEDSRDDSSKGIQFRIGNMKFSDAKQHSTKKKEVVEQLRSKFKNLGKELDEAHVVYTPLSDDERKNKWKIDDLHIQKSGRKMIVYYDYVNKRIGRTINGKNRFKDFLDQGNVNRDDNVIVIMDLECASTKTLSMIDDTSRCISEMEGVKIEDDLANLNIYSAEEMNSNGLPIFDRLVLHSLHHEVGSGDDALFNGIKKVQSVHRAMVLNNAEIGIQEATNVPYNQNCAAMEHLGSGSSEYLKVVVTEAEFLAKTFMEALMQGEIEILKQQCCRVRALLSWPRGKQDDQIDACKVLVTKLILGILREEEDTAGGADDGSRVKNAIKDPPGNCPKTMYDSSLYTDRDKENGLQIVLEEVSRLVKDGGVLLLDAQRIIMDWKNTSMEGWLKGRGFESFFNEYDLQAFRYKDPETDIKKVRIILVCRPLCWAFFSGESLSGRKLTRKHIQSQGMRAKTAYLLQIIVGTIQNKLEFLPIQSIWGNCITAFLMRMYLSQNLHVCEKAAVVAAKNMMHRKKNLFEDSLLKYKSSSRGLNRRAQRGLRTEHEHAHKKVRNILSKSKKQQDWINAVVDIIWFHEEVDGSGNRKKRTKGNQEEMLGRVSNKIGLDEGFRILVTEAISKKRDEDFKKFDQETRKHQGAIRDQLLAKPKSASSDNENSKLLEEVEKLREKNEEKDCTIAQQNERIAQLKGNIKTIRDLTKHLDNE